MNCKDESIIEIITLKLVIKFFVYPTSPWKTFVASHNHLPFLLREKPNFVHDILMIQEGIYHHSELRNIVPLSLRVLLHLIQKFI